MLRGIPDLISPDLLKILSEMGHGDDLVIGDLNFPGASNAKRLVRLDGHALEPVLKAILDLFPLDIYVDSPVSVMKVAPGDPTVPVIQDTIRSLVKVWDQRPAAVAGVERFDFYEKARNAYAIVTTGETKLYACVILKKGVFGRE
jgi:L-fucose mutarotase